jgi:two-component system, OmpR family, response regulator MtrA
MQTAGVPLIVCLTSNAKVRERVAGRLSDCGVVLMCADVAELRAVFCPAAQAEWAHVVDPTTVGEIPSLAVTIPPSLQPADGAGAGDLVIDPERHLVTWRGAAVPVTRLERELLSSLASPPVGVWTYERLFHTVWGGAYLGDTSILHSAMKRLRRKLRAVGEGVAVETVRGIGYRLVTG